MGKIIAVYGSPGSGKTSLSLMLARELYLKASDKGKVIFLSSDLNVPSIGLIFPNYKPDEIGTLSAVLDSTDISENNLLKNSVTIKSLNNFCCLGFKSGDNRYSFPVPTQNKLNSMFDILSEMSDYIVVDCSNDFSDSIAETAKERADTLFRVITPDLKGVDWYASRRKTDNPEGRLIYDLLCITEKDLYSPTEDVRSKVEKFLEIIPYSFKLRQQMLDGQLYEGVKDRAYLKAVDNLITAVRN